MTCEYMLKRQDYPDSWGMLHDDKVGRTEVILWYHDLLLALRNLELERIDDKNKIRQLELEAQQMDTENSNLHVENSKLQCQLDKAIRDYEYWRDKYLCEMANIQGCLV